MCTSSISQSFKDLEKSGLQLPLPLVKLQTSFIQASLEATRANKEGKATEKGEAPHHLSFQNFTLYPLPITKWSLLLTTCHSLLIVFHNPTLYPSLTSLEHQPPLLLPILSPYHLIPKGPSLICKPPTPFAQKCLIKRRTTLHPQTPFSFV